MGLYVRFQSDHCTAVPVADCLRAFRRQGRGPGIGLWDQGSSHRGPPMAAVPPAYPRLPIEACPAYAPELHPVEQLWNDVKGHTANSLPRHTREVRRS
jgi:putative transposase